MLHSLRINAVIILFFTLILLTPAFAQQHHQSQILTSPQCSEFTFDASASHDPDNQNITFLWDFGDGNTSTQPISTHKYTRSGDYDVTLTITDNSGSQNSTAQAIQRVRSNIPPIANLNVPNKICVNDIFIADGTGSYDDINNPLNYKWDFGDGTVQEFAPAQVEKSYQKGGKYKITLSVDDNSETVCSEVSTHQMITVNEPPIADAGQELIERCIQSENDFLVSFDASNSSDLNNDPIEYYWDLGDGNKLKGKMIKHQYSDEGTYDVKLIAKDNTNLGCGTSVDFVKVKLDRMPKAMAGNDIIACPSDLIEFDGTQSFASKKGTLVAKWFFGDGNTADGIKTTHSYSKPGKYQANLDVQNALNSMCPTSRDTKLVTINSQPTVDLKVPQIACTGSQVSFDASSASDADGDNLEYYWSFGDGTIKRGGAKVSHTYQQGGEYRVSVIVDDGLGSNCSTATAVTTIAINTAPVADIGPNSSCCVDQETSFNATGSIDPDGDQLYYSWDFGDGNQSTGVITSHSYSKSGQYNVILTVDDGRQTECSKVTANFKADINAQPVPIINIR